MGIVRFFAKAAVVAVFSLRAYGENPKFVWTGGGTPDNEGYLLWSDTANWQGGIIPTAAEAGGTKAGEYDFSNAAANTRIKCDVSTSHHMCVLTFGADQGTISLVQGNAADSALRTFSNGTITVPAGTTVDFGLNCAENNDQRGAEMKISGGGTFNFCSAGKFSGNRWKLAVEGTTTLGLNCTGAGINLDSVVVELKNHTAKLSLGNDTRIAAILSHSWGRGAVLLNGHKLTLSGGNALHTGNFAQYSVYGDSGDIEISGGNILTNVYADSFKAFEGDITLRNANLKNAGVTFPTATDVKIESSGVLTLSNNQTVASLTGSGTTGGVDIFAGNKLVVSGGDQGEKSYCARIAGGGDFEKNGGDTLVLSGANTLTGKTKVNAGTLKVLGSPAANAVEPAPYYSFDFEDSLADAVTGVPAKFYYRTDNTDMTTVPDGATPSEFCEGRNGGRGVRLHHDAAASVYYDETNAFNTESNAFTATVWMKPDEDMKLMDVNHGCHAIFYFGSGGNQELLSFKVYVSYGTNLNFSAGGYKTGDVKDTYPDYGFTGAVTEDDFYDGRWHMVTVTYSGRETKTITGYFDGRKLGEKTLAADVSPKGRLHLGWGNWGRLSGDFDDFKVLRRCQSASEIAAEFRGEVVQQDAFAALPPPVAHWAFDDAGNAGKDSSGNAYHLSPDGDAAPIATAQAIVDVPGASGKALAPSNMYYWAGAAFPEKFPSGGESWTLSVRCALAGLLEAGKYQCPMVFMWGENNAAQYSNDASGNDRRYFAVQFDNSNYRANRLGIHYQSSKYFNPNLIFGDVSYQSWFTEANWVHLVVSYSDRDGMKSYVDGVLVEQGNTTMRIEPVNILVGYRPNFKDSTQIAHPYCYFPGYIDDIAVWDTVLSAEQVRVYVRGLRTGSAGSPLSAESDLSIAEGATVEVVGTCVEAKSVAGGGTLKLVEHSSLALGGGVLDGSLTGLGQLTLTAPFKVADASGYYGNIVLSGSGAIDAPTYTKAVSLPEGCTVVLPSVSSLPLLRTGGDAKFPAVGSISFEESPTAEGVYLVAEAAELSVPDSFGLWRIGEDGGGQGGYRMKLFLEDGKVYLRVRKIRGTSVVLR